MKETSVYLKFLCLQSGKILENLTFKLRPQRVFKDSFSEHKERGITAMNSDPVGMLSQ